jgi:hypothetical protein
LEKETNAIAGAIALFSNIEFTGNAPNVGSDWAGFPVFAGGIIFRFVGGRFATEEHDNVGVLFDGT